ncbi:hypothetical protein HOD29_04480 [archaeon]|jgi:hypothetical protein|nr:hypothetical protein [archaeon]
MKNTKELLHELKHHAPFTLVATLIGVGIALLLTYLIAKPFEAEIFEILHPLHVIASAIVSAGIFYKYKPKIIPALLVGLISSIFIGSLSDVIFPFLGGAIFSMKPLFHLPLIEFPILIILSALIGSAIGILFKTTKLPHFFHVGLSIFASFFYLLAFSQNFSIIYALLSILIIFIAVLIPCCISDILLPFFFLKKPIKNCHCC